MPRRALQLFSFYLIFNHLSRKFIESREDADFHFVKNFSISKTTMKRRQGKFSKILAILYITFVSVASTSFENVTKVDDDTIMIEASDKQTVKFVASAEVHRPKRQVQNPASSIFIGFPGFDGNGFGNFEFPSLGGAHNLRPSVIGGISQIPQLKPIQKPSVDGPTTCRTVNGQLGKCLQLRACYPLLFPSSTAELGYSGLASTLRESGGPCTTTSTNSFLYAIPGHDNGVCCASEGSNFLVTPQPPLATTQRSIWSPAAPTEVLELEPYNCAGFYVIGGTNVAGRPYPWIVSIKDGRTNRHVCGGSLISSRSVLSAAHCVQQLDGQRVANMRVYLGANDINSAGRCTIVKKVKNIKYHRGFSMKTLHHDIAILTLESPVSMSNYIQTVSLGTTRVATGSQATVAGWGGVHFGGGTVGQLRHVSLDIIGNGVCAQKYIGHAPAGITQHQMCAGSPGRDSCVGDSGGPLMQNGVQIGVVSFGVNCGTQPGVYTRVSSYFTWINKNKS